MDRGATLPELLTVLAIVGICVSIAIPPLDRALDQAAVAEAADRYAAAHETTRQLAVARGTLARVELDTALRTATIALQRTRTAWDTVQVHPLGTARMQLTQKVVTFGPFGLGFGASNTRIVFARGAAADTLTVSRSGRLKRF